jgi:hypothetical protein
MVHHNQGHLHQGARGRGSSPPIRVVRTLALWLLGVDGFAIVFVAAFRLMNGLDLLTGDDPLVIAASQRNPQVEIGAVPGSGGAYQAIYQVVDRSADRKGYFVLSKGETLTGAMRMAPCGADGMTLPGWLPRFPQAKDWVCIAFDTLAGIRRHASFITSEDGLEAAFTYYESAIDTIPNTGGGSSRSSYPRLQWGQSRSNTDTGLSIVINYYYDHPGPPAPFVTIAFSEGG